MPAGREVSAQRKEENRSHRPDTTWCQSSDKEDRHHEESPLHPIRHFPDLFFAYTALSLRRLVRNERTKEGKSGGKGTKK